MLRRKKKTTCGRLTKEEMLSWSCFWRGDSDFKYMTEYEQSIKNMNVPKHILHQISDFWTQEKLPKLHKRHSLAKYLYCLEFLLGNYRKKVYCNGWWKINVSPRKMKLPNVWQVKLLQHFPFTQNLSCAQAGTTYRAGGRDYSSICLMFS